MTDDRIAALQHALAADASNHGLRVMLAELLHEGGRGREAVAEYRVLFDAGALTSTQYLAAARAALGQGDAEFAAQCIDGAQRAGVVDGVAELQERVVDAGGGDGVLQLMRAAGGEAPRPSAGVVGDRTSFGDVGGLDDVKKVIHRSIILPFNRPDLYAAYGRRAGAGVMLFGPPGCGKTMLARATAGECNLPFLNVRIEEILSPYFGESERNLHDLFERARSAAPCVVFLDELDALAFNRRKQGGSMGRSLVDQLLQELDSIGADNRDLLVLGATNAPWDVDEGLKRPGRFDRVVFVPPPDDVARQRILTNQLRERPTEGLDVAALAEATNLFSGADLEHLVNSAVDAAIEEALSTETTVPVARRHFDAALPEVRPTTIDWLSRARNYVEYANRDEQYREVAAYLKRSDIKGRA